MDSRLDHSPLWTRWVVAAAVFVSACGASVPEWCAADDAEVVLDVEPTRWSVAPALERVWRIDGSAEGQELVLPANVAVSAELQRIAVVDFQLGEVIVVSLDGRWLGRWGRRGPGPGEIGHALAARWTDAETLEVYDPVGSKVVAFDTAGVVIGESRIGAPFTAALGGGVAWINFTSGGSLVTRPAGMVPVSDGRMQVVVLRTDVSGASTDTLVTGHVPAIEPEGWSPFAVPGWPVPHAAVSGSGHVAISGVQPEYHVVIERPDSSDLVVCRTVDPLPSYDEDSADDLDPAIRAALLGAPEPHRRAAVGRVAYDAMGRLWVQRDLPGIFRPEDTVLGREGALFDVYRGEEYLGEIRMPDHVRFIDAVDNLIIGIERSELDEYSLVAYGLPM